MDLTRLECVLNQDDMDFDIEARLDGLRIAHAQCIRNGEHLVLADIRLAKDVSPPWPVLHGLLISWIGRRKPWRLERRGIGTALLKRLLREADAAGIREIKGSVMPEAIKSQPWLLPWYEAHGFTVGDPDRDCLRGAAKMVVRRR